jgi:hypothetical protein
MAITRPPVTDIWANTAAGSPDIATPTYFDTGFPAPGGVPVKPPRGFMNWLFKWTTQAGRYLLSRGVSDWDATEDQYSSGSIVRRLFVGVGTYWVCVGTPTTALAPESDLTNWQLWLSSPIATAGAYNQDIFAWRNEVQQRRFSISHPGFPTGNFVQWQELWDGPDAYWQQDNIVNVNLGRWHLGCPGGGGFESANPHYATLGNGLIDFYNDGYRFLRVKSTTSAVGGTPGSGTTSINPATGCYTTVFGDDTTIAMEWTFGMPTGSNQSNLTYVMGLVCNGEPLNAINNGAYFAADASDGHWYYITKGGGLNTTNLSGVLRAEGTTHRAAIVLMGKNQSGDAAGKAVFLIDGETIATVATTLPYGLPIGPAFGVRASSNTAPGGEMLVGPVRFSHSQAPGDVKF